MTAAQELILKIKKRIPFFQYSVYQDDFDAAIEKEKEQIIAAMNYSTYREMKGINVSNEEYYNQNYIQKEEQKQHIIDIMEADEKNGLYSGANPDIKEI